MTSCLALFALGILWVPLIVAVIAAFWFPEIWSWLGIGTVTLALALGLSILPLTVGYFRRLANRREEIKLNFPEYIIVLRRVPADFDPAQAQAPIVESVYHVPIPKEL